MALERYNKKRKFGKTPEPKGMLGKRGRALHFVVQKHDASHLHYDFRLEMGGVMKSWAVPKGPSLNPKDKRLAIMTEDHPISYNTFEGHIPEGLYGGGDVIVWDTGTYWSEDTDNAKESEQEFLAGLRKGALTFYLNGKKLRGLFTLIKFKGNEKQWLLIKKDDEHATEEDVLADNRSVLSLKRLTGKTEKKSLKKSWKPLPLIKPMLATLADQPFDDPEWIFEIKWDGYRAIADTRGTRVALYSRNFQSFTEKYTSVVSLLEEVTESVVFDGEIIGFNKDGVANFQSLQNVGNTSSRLEYIIFDLLHLNGRDLFQVPLLDRKLLLKELLEKYPRLTYSEHIEKRGVAFFKEMEKRNFEGMMAKKKNSHYAPGVRSDYWLKVKHHNTDEAVIVGFTEPRGSRNYFGSLVLAQYHEGELRFIGHTGTGFTQAILRDLHKKMSSLKTSRSSLKEKVPLNAPITWIKPKLVAQVKFSQWTEDHLMRQPVYLGLREDKSPTEVTGEVKKEASEEIEKNKTPIWDKPPMSSFTNLEKIYFPKIGLTKGGVIAYYEKIAPYILSYLKNRPESLNRHPNGVGKPNFFQKNFSSEVPDFAETITVHSESTNEDIRYLICNNKETLLYMANLGCIEINPWNSRASSLDRPDYWVLDIDPDDNNTWAEIARVGNVAKEILDLSCEKGYLKTSGKTGIHIFIPLGGKYLYEDVRRFAEIIARMVHERLPNLTSLERSPKNRKGKIYIDYLQNSEGQTLAAPYSLRPTPNATVSTPLHWDELTSRKDPRTNNYKTIFARLRKYGDLWKDMAKESIDLEKAIMCLQNKKR
jgi:bifunctional non-homologous end joining protein LigD